MAILNHPDHLNRLLDIRMHTSLAVVGIVLDSSAQTLNFAPPFIQSTGLIIFRHGIDSMAAAIAAMRARSWVVSCMKMSQGLVEVVGGEGLCFLGTMHKDMSLPDFLTLPIKGIKERLEAVANFVEALKGRKTSQVSFSN